MWIAMFSQSGTEIAEISKKLNRWPDLILSNNKEKDLIHKDIRMRSSLYRGTHNKLIKLIEHNVKAQSKCIPFITLHGYLRIMPDLPYEMFNGHPGDIETYPELIGKDPQKKAVELKLPSTGCIIHKVTQNLDQGPIIAREKYIMKGDETDLILYERLRIIAIDMWIKFLKERMNEAV